MLSYLFSSRLEMWATSMTYILSDRLLSLFFWSAMRMVAVPSRSEMSVPSEEKVIISDWDS
jgi:hypothetical protein